MLVAPMYLHHASLNTFLVGLGIYLGKSFTAKLIPSFGSGSLGILLIYIGTTLISLAIFYVAQSLKYLENLPRKRHYDPKDTAGPDPATPMTRQNRTLDTQNGQTMRLMSGNELLRSSPNQDVNVEIAWSSTDVLDPWMRPRYPPVSDQSSRIPDVNERSRSDNMPQINDVPQSNDIAQGNNILQSNNMPQSNDMSPEIGALADDMSILSVRTALIGQIRAQEELVQASKRLLAALEASSSFIQLDVK
jgi:hypothetical protein